MKSDRILVIRLGAMGDVIHTLPAVAALGRVTWVIDPRWAPLLEGNPHVERVVPFNRRSISSVRSAIKQLRSEMFDHVFDFQGLMKSALIAAASGARQRLGFHRDYVREWPAALLYHRTVLPVAAHVVDANLELAGGGEVRFHLPNGTPEGTLPDGPFVLASPFGGWAAKQWPLENYAALAKLLPIPLVMNVALGTAIDVPVHIHASSIAGLIYATRRAAAVVGIDSGPLHLAAALGKPGVAIFGPTDPARNGPYGRTIRVLRSPLALTSYKRGDTIGDDMRAITPSQVREALAL